MPDPNTTTPAPAAAREPVTPCPECGGLSGAHGMVHTRHGNGGGSNRPCSRREPVTQDDREVVRNAVGGVLRDVSNYPERAQSALWGRDMGSLVERVADAILAARPSVPTVTGEQRARLIALTYASDDGTEYEHDHDEQDGGAPDCPACWAGAIRAALGTEVQPTCQTQADEDAVTYPTPYTPSNEADLGGLARVIDPAIYPDINRLTGDGWAASKRAASAVLRSRWLAAHDARVVLDYVRTKEIPRVEITNPERIRPFIAQQIAEARRDAFNEAADEVHVEARWAGETQRRGLHAYYRPEERLLMVERTLRACAAAETPDGGA